MAKPTLNQICNEFRAPGLEPPLPRLIIVPLPIQKRVCTCGAILRNEDERASGTCGICDARARLRMRAAFPFASTILQPGGFRASR